MARMRVAALILAWSLRMVGPLILDAVFASRVLRLLDLLGPGTALAVARVTGAHAGRCLHTLRQLEGLGLARVAFTVEIETRADKSIEVWEITPRGEVYLGRLLRGINQL